MLGGTCAASPVALGGGKVELVGAVASGAPVVGNLATRINLYDNRATFSLLVTRDGSSTLTTRDGTATLTTRDGSGTLTTRDGTTLLTTRDGSGTLITR